MKKIVIAFFVSLITAKCLSQELIVSNLCHLKNELVCYKSEDYTLKFQKGKLISVSSNDSILHYDLSRQTITFITALKDSVLIQLHEEYLRLQIGDIDSILSLKKPLNSNCLNIPNSVSLEMYKGNIIGFMYQYCALTLIGLGDSVFGVINLMPSLNHSDNSYAWTVSLNLEIVLLMLEH